MTHPRVTLLAQRSYCGDLPTLLVLLLPQPHAVWLHVWSVPLAALFLVLHYLPWSTATFFVYLPSFPKCWWNNIGLIEPRPQSSLEDHLFPLRYLQLFEPLFFLMQLDQSLSYIDGARHRSCFIIPLLQFMGFIFL